MEIQLTTNFVVSETELADIQERREKVYILADPDLHIMLKSHRNDIDYLLKSVNHMMALYHKK